MILPRDNQRGLIKMIVVIFIALLILAALGLNLRSIVGSSTFQDNWSFLRDLALHIWDAYLKGIAVYVWDNILWPLITKVVRS